MDITSLQKSRQQWITTVLESGTNERQSYWSESAAVGSQLYIETVQTQLGYRANGRQCRLDGEHYIERAGRCL